MKKSVKAARGSAKTVSMIRRFLRQEQQFVERQIGMYSGLIENKDLLDHFELHVLLMMMELHLDILIELEREQDGEFTLEELKAMIAERLRSPDFLYETLRDEIYFSEVGYLQTYQAFMLEILEDCLDHPLYPEYKKAMRHYVAHVLPEPVMENAG